MKIIKSIYLNENDDRIIELDHNYSLLSNFLRSDIQHDSDCDVLKEMYEDVLSGNTDRRSFSGNAHTAKITKDKIVITCDVVDNLEPLELDPESFFEALEQWKDFLINVWQKRDQHGREV